MDSLALLPILSEVAPKRTKIDQSDCHSPAKPCWLGIPESTLKCPAVLHDSLDILLLDEALHYLPVQLKQLNS